MGGCTSLACGKEFGKVQELTLQCQNMMGEGEQYDYTETKQIVKSKLRISDPGYIVRLDKKILFFQKTHPQNIPSEAHIMLEVGFDNGNVSLNYAPGLEDSDFLDTNITFKKVPWLVAGPFPPGSYGYKLKEEDVVRFGRVQFIIKRLNAKGSAVTDEQEEGGIRANRRSRSMKKRLGTMTWETSLLANRILTTPSHHAQNGDQSGTSIARSASDFSIAYRENIKMFGQFTPQPNEKFFDFNNAVELERQAAEEQEGCCRICLCEEDDPDDPIVRPCRCQGTMRDVHVKCFKKWLSKHVVTKNSKNMCSIIWQQLKCELCGYEVENFLEANSKRYELIEFPKLPQPHVALEYYVGGKSKGFHFLKFVDGKDTLTFGKATESDLRVNDNTVSKNHAAISLHDGEFYIKDLDSKYGTSVLVDEPEKLFMTRGQDFSLQINRSVVTCHIDTVVKQLPPRRHLPARTEAMDMENNDNKQKIEDNEIENNAIRKEKNKEVTLVTKKVEFNPDVDSPILSKKKLEIGAQKPSTSSTEVMSTNESLNHLKQPAIEIQDIRRERPNLTINAAATYPLHRIHSHIRESSREYIDSPEKTKKDIDDEPLNDSIEIQKLVLPTSIEKVDSLNKEGSYDLSPNHSIQSEESKNMQNSRHSEDNDSKNYNEELNELRSSNTLSESKNKHRFDEIQNYKQQDQPNIQKKQIKGRDPLKLPSLRITDPGEGENDTSLTNKNTNTSRESATLYIKPNSLRRQSQPDPYTPRSHFQSNDSQTPRSSRRAEIWNNHVNTATKTQDEPYYQKSIENGSHELVKAQRAEKLQLLKKNLEIYSNKSEGFLGSIKRPSLIYPIDLQKMEKSHENNQISRKGIQNIENSKINERIQQLRQLKKQEKQVTRQEEEEEEEEEKDKDNSIDVPNCRDYPPQSFRSGSGSMSYGNIDNIESKTSKNGSRRHIGSTILSLGDLSKKAGINIDIEG